MGKSDAQGNTSWLSRTAMLFGAEPYAEFLPKIDGTPTSWPAWRRCRDYLLHLVLTQVNWSQGWQTRNVEFLSDDDGRSDMSESVKARAQASE